MQIQTDEMTAEQLNWAVAKAVGHEWVWFTWDGIPMERSDSDVDAVWEPTTNWAQAGPIMERESISITSQFCDFWDCQSGWYGHMGSFYEHGPTPLIAAMRIFVASKLGDTVDIPEGLL